MRHIEKKLADFGYTANELPARVIGSIDFARSNMKTTIYDQAMLECMASSFPQMEETIENEKVNGLTASDVQKILNLTHAWEFILYHDIVESKSGYYMLCHIVRLVNEGGRIRGAPVTLGGSTYMSPLLNEIDVKHRNCNDYLAKS